jgi:hypothetical protein
MENPTMKSRACIVAIVLVAAVMGCDTKVTNPGPVQDEFLFKRDAAFAMVSGAGRALSSAMNWISYTGAAVSREVHPAGSTGSFGITSRWQIGQLQNGDGDLDTHWETAQRARWVAEETVRRVEDAKPPTPGVDLQTPNQYADTLRLAYLYAAYANRLLGENMCDAVIDGSGKLAGTVYFQRAESLFTKALAVTGGVAAQVTAQNSAAYAGRAQVRVWLGKWNEAVADAGQVAIGFSFTIPYFNIGDDNQRNRIFWASGNTRESGSAYRAHTQWSTWYYDYAQQTKDPRVPVLTTTQTGDAAIDCCGKVPFYPEAKYASSAAAIRLASGREMRLIEAEAKLRANDLAGALVSMNLVRTNAGTSAVAAATTVDAWKLLKRERGIELWLEARRLGDFRRWKADNTPGALDPLEQVGPASHLTQQDLCFPISVSEQQTNPNLKG